MPLEGKKYLFDIVEAAKLLNQFSRGKTFDDYQRDALLRSGVERQFEIIGEALSQLSKFEAQTVSRITDARRIIAFRNILIHGYAHLDNRVVWDILQTKLPALLHEVKRLLDEPAENL